MARSRLYWKLPALLAALLTAAVLLIGWLAAGTLEHHLAEQQIDNLEARARTLAEPVAALLKRDAAGGPDSPAAADRLQAICRAVGQVDGTRFTVVRPDGAPLADSHPDPGAPHNLAGRPEIAAALQLGRGAARRYSPTEREDLEYVAVRIADGDRTLGLIRTAQPVSWIDNRVRRLWLQTLLAGLLVSLVGAGIGWQLRRRIEQPLHEIARGAEQFAHGQFQSRISLTHPGEDGGLADTLNRMAEQLNDRINTVLRQRNEQEAILGSMIEGVVAVDAAEQIISMNQVAAKLFDVSAESVRGRLFQEVSRIPALQDFLRRTLTAEAPQNDEFTRYENGRLRTLQAHGAVLRDGAGRRMGAVMVLHDVTQLRRLESLQREFVANVSHELKTPVTSIKGFIETLQDGALADPVEATRFLAIIARHADRLGAIIDDLLLLSKLEQDTAAATLERAPADLRELVAAAIDACAARAADKQIALTPVGASAAPVEVNARLFTQVVTNLIDNAIKYSEPGRTVELELTAGPAEITLAVRDHGCGIPAEHLPRLGERFYRVDAARSRKQGGTGLGLAIARQILRAHGGHLAVTSEIGVGSTFTLHLPRPQPAGESTPPPPPPPDTPIPPTSTP